MEAAQVTVPRRRSLLFWVLLAIVMVALSYAVAMALALACLSLTLYWSSSIFLAVGGLVLGITILWSLIPRRDRFVPPGALLQRSHHPHLFAELDRIAGSLNEELPKEVYLVPQVNAWVAQRGGILGVGSRRVMAIGLPLLGVLTVSQFRAVLAHEFAHYYGGDTRLGPWVYRTRDAMVRTFQVLGEPSAILQVMTRFVFVAILYQLVVLLLVGYWKLFLRCTQFISRKQEYRADELACYVAGSRPLSDGLMAIHRATPAAQLYWNSEIAPIANAGFLPPIAAGFAAFVAAPSIAPAVQNQLDKQLREERTQAFDSHPPLRERIAKAGDYRPVSAQVQLGDDAPAYTLVDSLDAAELDLLRLMAPAAQGKVFQSAGWDGVKAQVAKESWRQSATHFSSILKTILVSELPQTVRDLSVIGSQIPDPPGMLLTREQRRGRAIELLGAGLARVLLDHGWQLVAQPGELYLTQNGDIIRPGPLIAELANGKINQDAWRQRMRELGVADCSLAGDGAQTTP